jgi:hypothetical protein
VEPAVSAGAGWVGVTAYFYARNAEDAMDKLSHALPLVEELEVL